MKSNMRCSCGGVLRVTNTYSAGAQARTSGARCLACQARATIVTFVAFENPEKGDGASAVAPRIRVGALAPRLAPKEEPVAPAAP